MARVTPEQAAAKWRDRLTASTQQITDGVNRVQTAPGTLAARQRQTWLARINASADKWARNVARVSLEDWRQAMLSVGVQRVAQGAQAKVGKVQAFQAEFLPYLDAGVAKVKAMPKTSLADSVNRAVAMIQHNAAFKRGSGSGA